MCNFYDKALLRNDFEIYLKFKFIEKEIMSSIEYRNKISINDDEIKIDLFDDGSLNQ